MKGFIDLQVNGYHGVDFNSDDLTDDAISTCCHRLRDDGVASILPTIITDQMPAMIRRIGRLADAIERDAQIRSMMVGIHVEGPFLNPLPGFVGAHPADSVRDASVELAAQLVDAGRGLVRLFTLAPESAGAAAVTRWLTDRSIVVAGGHSDATVTQLKQCIDQGLRLYTHLGNGCPGQLHRHDNIVQRVLSLADQIAISFIADGHHVPWVALGNYLKCIPEEHVVIVTDAISAAGLGPGFHRLAGQMVEVDQNLAAWAEGHQHFAGCATTMTQMAALLRNHLAIDAERIDRWTRINPERLIARS